MTITDEDRAAAERMHSGGAPFTCFDCADELTAAFARHRLAERERIARLIETGPFNMSDLVRAQVAKAVREG